MGGMSGFPVGSVFGLPGRAPVGLMVRPGKVRTSMVPDELVQQWQAAYRSYGHASQMVAMAEPGDRNAARSMAAASRDVAVCWKELGAAPGLPWWTSAAVGAAVQAFEFQARDWEARAGRDGYSPAPVLRPTPHQRPHDELGGRRA
ncbi:hypothetical protein EV186_104205 [Labedaea rhizosphaerae]|uniref:Uncharacterized protein n=1 Tax=Labedaea rhizosphaerae TaxID=598644 RepID=A0A4R6S9S4_LABRH|nr:hypothetical protein EV186_104205 [Labedaea rhizosphaerae]